MKKIILELENIIKESSNETNSFKLNLLKSYLQVFALNCIYSEKEYSNLVFYGGSVLSQCYGLPRLSEDLDFVDLTGQLKLDNLADSSFCALGSDAPKPFKSYLKNILKK